MRNSNETRIEIRSLHLTPGTREEFHRLYEEWALRLLKRWNFDEVAHAPSLHDENSYYVIRRFDRLAQREQMEDAYYASDDWRKGLREAILAMVQGYTDIVFELDDYSFTPEMAALLDLYLEPFQQFASKDALLMAYQVSKPVASIVKALAWRQGITRMEAPVRAEYAWIVPELWREFLYNEKTLSG